MALARAALTLRDLAVLRLRNQRLIATGSRSPDEVVGWLGEVHSEDYHGAKWAVAQRMKRPSDDEAS